MGLTKSSSCSQDSEQLHNSTENKPRDAGQNPKNGMRTHTHLLINVTMETTVGILAIRNELIDFLRWNVNLRTSSYDYNLEIDMILYDFILYMLL